MSEFFRISVVSVDLEGLNPNALPDTLSDFIDKLAKVLGDARNIVVCGNFLAPPTDLGKLSNPVPTRKPQLAIMVSLFRIRHRS